MKRSSLENISTQKSKRSDYYYVKNDEPIVLCLVRRVRPTHPRSSQLAERPWPKATFFYAFQHHKKGRN